MFCRDKQGWMRRGPCITVIVRGIEKRQIVDDDKYRKSFVDRMGSLALETDTVIYAWTLMGCGYSS